jgi:hydrogenase expression/formation protein HypE
MNDQPNFKNARQGLPGPLPTGKLPVELLRRLLGRYTQTDARIRMGAGVGFDATVIEFGDTFLVAKTDPVTFVADEIGWYAVHVNANDVAMTGAVPRWFLATLLLPQGKTGPLEVERIFAQIERACASLGVILCGGHTEVTFGLTRPLVIGLMLGEVEKDALVRPQGCEVGDAVIITKGIAIEGTAVLARENPRMAKELGSEERRRCSGFLEEPGISVVKDAKVACKVARIHAMHDPTEGGVATALHELAEAAGVGMKIRRRAIPVYPETAKACRLLDLDPLGLLASGALLLTVSRADAQKVIQVLDREGIPAAEIGRVVPAAEGVVLAEDGKTRPMPIFQQDEITRALE